MQRVKKSLLAGMLTTVFTTLLLVAQVAEAAPLTCGTWSVVPSPNVGQGGNNLFAVAAVSANNIWTVGTYTNGGNLGQTLIEHWNGSRWSIVPSPSPGQAGNQLLSVAVSTSEIWAAGTNYDQTLIEYSAC